MLLFQVRVEDLKKNIGGLATEMDNLAGGVNVINKKDMQNVASEILQVR